MYWPNGVPRVYAVNGPNIAHVSDDVNRQGTSNHLAEERNSTDSQEPTDGARERENPEDQGDDLKPEQPPSQEDASQWEQEAIGGLCVSRSGHMFATITESSISLWQTRVCLARRPL
jgi:hypothetical protein